MMQSMAPRTVIPVFRSERNRRAARTKDFRDDDRKDCQVLLFVQSGVESLYVRSQGPVEEVCPRAGVDDDHPRVVRADLHPAMSPSHESFPFRRRNAR